MTRGVPITALLLLAAPALFANDATVIEVGLVESVKAAVSTSARLSSSEAAAQAATSRADWRASMLWPKLSLDGSVRYTSVLPTISVPGLSLNFGDNESYSIGPLLTWTLWDGGALRNAWHSQEATAAARFQDRLQTERQVVLQARVSYLTVLMASEQERLVADSVRMAQRRQDDIEKRRRAGAASEVDAISARKEVLNLQLRFREAQSQLGSALRDLFALSGRDGVQGLSEPADARIRDVQRVIGTPPTVRIRMEALEEVAKELDESSLPGAPEKSGIERHPQIAAISREAASFRFAAKQSEAAYWPSVNVLAKSSIDYPNAPSIQRIHQNTVAATLSWSLYEFGRIRHEIAEKELLADAAGERQRQAEIDLARDWRKALDQIAARKAERETHRRSIEESERLVSLIYQSYLAGRSRLLEVQDAHVAALNARIADRQNEIEILIQAAILRELAGENRP